MELLHDRVSRMAGSQESRRAVLLGSERLTYEDLEVESNQLSRLLGESGVGPGKRVALLLEKSPQAVVGMLATLKCGAAYVPLDPHSPGPRLRRILSQAEVQVILAHSATSRLLQELVADSRIGASVGWLSQNSPPAEVTPAFRLNDVRAASSESSKSPVGPADPAHLLFTSGSTGVPKGVVVTHGNVTSFLDWATEHFGLEPTDRNSGHSSFHFDLSTFDVFGTLTTGGELHLVPRKANLLPTALGSFIRESELTQWFSVPSAMSYMAAHGVVRHGDFPSLKRVIWCGEVFPTPMLIHWMERIPHPTYTNLYGPTETTIASTYYTVREIPSNPGAPIPIGTACKGERVHVMDEALRAVPTGTLGEICISGPGLSPGYWKDPEKTGQAFVTLPPNREGWKERVYRTGDLGRLDQAGRLHFAGRTDTQIKSRGHRIELGEIEAALGAVQELAEYAVEAIPADGFEGMTICCAYVPKDGRQLDPSFLKDRLRTDLPLYMLPTEWQQLDALPRNANGKVDRNLLKERFIGAVKEA